MNSSYHTIEDIQNRIKQIIVEKKTGKVIVKPQTKFDNDLQDGISAENLMLRIIRKKYPKAIRIKSYFKKFDIFVPETSQKFEIKYDRVSELTGNIAIEFEYDGKPSGIKTSEADYFIFVTNRKAFIIKTDKLKKLIIETEMFLKVVKGGDNNKSKMYLIRINDFEKYNGVKTFLKDSKLLQNL